MSKGKKKSFNKRSPNVPAGAGRIHPELADFIKITMMNNLRPIEGRMHLLQREFDNLKANLMVINTFMEKKGIINREEFFAEANRFMMQEQGVVDMAGNMPGRVMVTLYNLEA